MCPSLLGDTSLKTSLDTSENLRHDGSRDPLEFLSSMLHYRRSKCMRTSPNRALTKSIQVRIPKSASFGCSIPIELRNAKERYLAITGALTAAPRQEGHRTHEPPFGNGQV